MRQPRFNPARFLARQLNTASGPSRVPLLLSPSQFKQLPKSTTLALDVSWHMPGSPRSALAEYLSGPRIPHAKRFDLDEVAELDISKNPLSLTHMLPSKETFKEACENIGISDETHVVCYDSLGVFSSPRGLYTFKAFGHDKVSVLDGGLPRWIHEGEEVDTGDVGDVGRSEYTKAEGPNPDLVRSYEQIVKNSEKDPESPEAEVVLDHRPYARWEGSAPEPRPGLASGHIPNSLSAPFLNYLSPPSDTKPYTSYKSLEELKEVLTKAVGGQAAWDALVKGDKGLVFTCGSGMTAAIGWLANELIRAEQGGNVKSSIYDESWTGYASRQESKVVKGKDA